MKKILFLLLGLSSLCWTSCNKIKYTDFKITGIDLFAYPDQQLVNPIVRIDVEGPGLSERSSGYIDYFEAGGINYAMDWEGERGIADYNFTVVVNDADIATLTVDFGKFKGQDTFVVEGNGIEMRFTVSWNKLI